MKLQPTMDKNENYIDGEKTHTLAHGKKTNSMREKKENALHKIRVYFKEEHGLAMPFSTPLRICVRIVFMHNFTRLKFFLHL